jgi:hypothetical protein
VRNTPTGCGNDLPPGKQYSENFQKSFKIEKCKQICSNVRIWYFINRGGLLTGGGGYLEVPEAIGRYMKPSRYIWSQLESSEQS